MQELKQLPPQPVANRRGQLFPLDMERVVFMSAFLYGCARGRGDIDRVTVHQRGVRECIYISLYLCV